MHPSATEALAAVAEARDRGQPVFAKTCPQYLVLSDRDLDREGFEGATFVCSPPLRSAEHQAALWTGLAADDLQVVATDHCPFCFAEALGFFHVVTFDSTVPGQEPFVIYPQILAATRRVAVGPLVTNPVTRDPTVTASAFTALNQAFGPRTACGIGRGDSAVRVTGRRPASLAELAEAIRVIRELTHGSQVMLRGRALRLPWVEGLGPPVWMAAYRPRALELVGRVADGLVLQLADPAIAHWAIRAVRTAAQAAGRDPDALAICVAAPAYVGDDLDHQPDQLRWVGGMVGNHVPEIVRRNGAESAEVPRALTDDIRDRRGYDYAHHGRPGHPSALFVPDPVVDRFCILGPAPAHRDRLRELAVLGVSHYALYLMHDRQRETLEAYGSEIIPGLDRA